jgi:serine/threonine protein kinase
MPFKSGSLVQIASRICRCDYDNIPDHVSPEIQEIIKKCLILNARERPSVFEILQS